VKSAFVITINCASATNVIIVFTYMDATTSHIAAFINFELSLSHNMHVRMCVTDVQSTDGLKDGMLNAG